MVDQGTHDELLERGGLYAQLYNLQFQDGGKPAEPQTGRKKRKLALPNEQEEPPRWSLRGILSGGLWRKRG